MRPPRRDQAPCSLGVCDGSGFVVDEQTMTARDCRCRAGRRKSARMRRLEAQIPARYRAISFEHTDVIDIERRNELQLRELRTYVRNLDANLDAGRGLWLCGGCGTGKTALAMIVSRAALDAGRTVAIYSLPRLLSVIREAMNSEGGLLGFLDLLATVDLLHLDDLGAEYRTDWTIEQLYSVINARYQDQRAVVVTSNPDPDQLARELGDRIVSRLEGMCDVLPFHGNDARRDRFDADPAVLEAKFGELPLRAARSRPSG
jgi:DNA replication protein DnaC